MHHGNGIPAIMRFGNGAMLNNFELYFFFSGGVTSLVYIFFFFKFKKIFLSGLSRRRFGDYCSFCSLDFELSFT